MEKLLRISLFICVSFLTFEKGLAQCGGGKIKCSLNWDYLQFLPAAGITGYTTPAQAQTQNFAIGTKRVTITHNYTGANAPGEDATHTGDVGSFATGEDLHFIGNGTITYTFSAAVDSVKFSLYDVDRNQRITVSSPALGSVVNMVPVSATNLSITNNNTASARVDAGGSIYANNANGGTVNVIITNPVLSITTFTVTVTNTGTTTGETGDFWMSDLTACTPGTFSANYFAVSKPFTNQAGYIVTSRNDSFYFVNPANGVAKFIFHDPNGDYANSVAYDPVRHEIYYAFSLTLPGPAIDPNNKVIRRYNYDKDTFGVVIQDITAFAPIFEQGVESGAAAFYDGSLYLGIEASASGTNESTVWKIDFNASGVPTTSSQVYAAPGAGRDWGDIAVVNGTLVDFDSRPTAPNYFHQDLYTKAVTSYTPATVDAPRQAAVDWNNVIYNIGGSGNSYVVGGVTIATGTIATYNGNGTINVASIDTIKRNGVAEMGSWGDAGEAFKPRVDYGDAPASFDPATGDPAVHEISNSLYFGSKSDDEWTSRGQTTLANSDNFDDGMIMGSLVNSSSGTFYCNVRFFNNTGSTATICGWVDFNGNGKFDPSEGVARTLLPSLAATQSVYLTWTGVSSSLVAGSYTYIRLRITTTANAMTVNNPTGFFDIGEVEDYRLPVTINPLKTVLVNFDAAKTSGNHAVLTWAVSDEEAGLRYTLQRSVDGVNWENVSTQLTTAAAATNHYSYTDSKTLSGTTYYRLQMHKDGDTFSETKKLTVAAISKLQAWPNPARDAVTVSISCETRTTATLQVYNAAGQNYLSKTVNLVAGANNIPLDASRMSNGFYWVQLLLNGETHTQRLLIKK